MVRWSVPFCQGSFPRGLFMKKKMAPMLHFYVTSWCLCFQKIRLYQDKTSSKTGQDRGPPPPFTPCFVSAVTNLKIQFLKFCHISFMSISCYITINPIRSPFNQSVGVMYWLHRQNVSDGSSDWVNLCCWWGTSFSVLFVTPNFLDLAMTTSSCILK